VSRLPQTLLVVALLVATAFSFAFTERLKLERSPITATRVDKIFSPVCECLHDVAVISFVLRRRETVTLQIVDSKGHTVRTLVRKRREPKGRVSYTWDGRDDEGVIVPDGAYRPRVHLERHGRTLVLPNRIHVDSRAPTITLVGVSPRVFSPDGDGRADRVTARYEIDEPARAMMLVNGRRRVFERYRKTSGKLVWFGQLDGSTAPPGTYEIRLRAVDQAGNASPRTRAVDVRVLYVELTRERIRAVAGRRFRAHVLTTARSYRWRIAGRTGIARKPVLALRAPAEPGEYSLYVRVGRHADRATVVVSAPPP
jgi:hypothetical protein